MFGVAKSQADSVCFFCLFLADPSSVRERSSPLAPTISQRSSLFEQPMWRSHSGPSVGSAANPISLAADNRVECVPPLSLSPALSKSVQEDTREECAKFGEVLAVFIPRPHPPRFGNGRLVGVKDSALHVRMAVATAKFLLADCSERLCT